MGPLPPNCPKTKPLWNQFTSPVLWNLHPSPLYYPRIPWVLRLDASISHIDMQEVLIGIKSKEKSLFHCMESMILCLFWKVLHMNFKMAKQDSLHLLNLPFQCSVLTCILSPETLVYDIEYCASCKMRNKVHLPSMYIFLSPLAVDHRILWLFLYLIAAVQPTSRKEQITSSSQNVFFWLGDIHWGFVPCFQ